MFDVRTDSNRMFRALFCLGLITFGLALLGALLAPPTAPTPNSSAMLSAHDTGQSDTCARQLAGFALNVHHSDNHQTFLDAIDELAGLGFNSLEVTTPCFQTNGASDDIRVVVGPGRSPSRAHLRHVLRHARHRGLTTLLMPIVLFTQPRGNEWRGKIQPEDWSGWWESYRCMIDDFLDIAVETDVEIFCVGSELLSTERQSDRWRKLIAHVRQRFKGRLLYSTNWDHYQVPLFWDDLDMIGINGYWDLTAGSGTDEPSPEHLSQRWRKVRADVLAFAGWRDRPILFTEIGYPSLPWALKDPWNYVPGTDQIQADAVSQARGYAAFLSAWDGLLHPPQSVPTAQGPMGDRRLEGVFFYEWDVYHKGGPRDTGYGVRGKPALDVLKTWLHYR